MGADYTAMAAIGLAFKAEDLTVIKRTKAFPHDYPEDFDFCPKTKKPLWVDKKVSYDGFDGDKLLGYPVISAGCGDETLIACLISANDTYSNGGKTVDMRPLDFALVAAKKRMKADLEPLGIWDEKEFGLWTVLHCSV